MKKFYSNIGTAAVALLTAVTFLACAQEAKGRTAADGPLPEIGKAAPRFTLTDTNGKTHSLDQYKGKWVVLEWLNHECPYVRKHYGGGAMQALQKKYAGKVTWLSIVSSAPGKQ